jgi:hypothetical protein
MQRQSGQNMQLLKMELLSEKLSTVQIAAQVYLWAFILIERPAEDAVIQSRMNDLPYHRWLPSIVCLCFGHVVLRLLGFHNA